MKKTPRVQSKATPHPSISAPAEAIGEAYYVSWRAAFAVLAVVLLLLIWYPLARINAQMTVTINEGFNTYWESVAANGVKLYGTPPQYTYANYPPLSFHVVGLLGRLTGDINVAGRWISLFAYLAIGLFAGLIVRCFTSCWRPALYAALCWLIWLCAFDVVRVAYNDPHVLGIAVSMAGLFCYLRRPDSPRWLAASAALFAVSLFIKQSLLPFPAAVALQLFLTARQRLVIWMGTAVGVCVVLLGLTFAVDGSSFFAHLNFPRMYYFNDIVNSMTIYLTFVQVGFATACLWILRTRTPGPRMVLVSAFIGAHLLTMVLLGGAGAGLNHLYEGMLATLMIASLAVPSIEALVRGTRFPRLNYGVLLVLPLFLTTLIVLPRRIPSDLARVKELPAAENEFQAASAFLRQQPGPAMCETLLLCYAAGKPFEYDTFAVDELIRTGKVPMDEILGLLDSRHFRSVQIELGANEPLQPAPRIRFPGPFMRLLFTRYKVSLRTPKYTIFVPRES